MPETIAITVHAAALGPKDLAVADAMRQVLDIIEIVDAAASVEASGDVRVVWRLRNASTNSPFTVEAEGWSTDPGVVVGQLAARAAERTKEAFAALLRKEAPPSWMGLTELKAAKRVFERNLNGIGQTDLHIARDPIFIVPSLAATAVSAIEHVLFEIKQHATNLSRTEFGSIEGEIVAAATYYYSPSIIVRERLSGHRVTCVLSSEAAQQIGPEHSLADIWSGQRVLISGALHFDADGNLAKIEAESLVQVQTRDVDLADIRALDITGGLSTSEFVRLIRGGDDA